MAFLITNLEPMIWEITAFIEKPVTLALKTPSINGMWAWSATFSRISLMLFSFRVIRVFCLCPALMIMSSLSLPEHSIVETDGSFRSGVIFP